MWTGSDEHNARILITRRPSHVHLGGAWELPGGKVDDNESPRDGAVRELHEETDVRAPKTDHVITVTHAYDDRTVEMHAFAVVLDHMPHISENEAHVESQWVSIQEFEQTSFPEGNRGITNAVAAHIRNALHA